MMNFKDYEILNEILDDLSYVPTKISKTEWHTSTYSDFRIDYECTIDDQEMFVSFEFKTGNINKGDVTDEKLKLIVEIAFGSNTNKPGKAMDTLNIGPDFVSHVFSSINYIFNNKLLKDIKNEKELQEAFKKSKYKIIEITYGKFTPKKDFDDDKRRQKIYDYVLQKIFKWKFELKFASSFYYSLNQPIKIK